MQTFNFTSSDLTNSKLTVTDARIVDFVIADNLGNLVMPSMRYILPENAVEVDFTGWDVAGTWTIRKRTVQDGRDAESGLTADQYLLSLYLLSSQGAYSPSRHPHDTYVFNRHTDTPPSPSHFTASGTSQYVGGNILAAVIPAYGTGRQWFATDNLGDCLYRFQVFTDATMICDTVQNKNSTLVMAENLPFLISGTRPQYFWRVRTSGKRKDRQGQLIWGDWSHNFPFTVNTPPTRPTNLAMRQA